MSNAILHKPKLVLASSSPYRKELLQRLGLPFETCSPAVDETAQATEPAEQLATRLALTKARKVAGDYPDALVIGCDQVALLNNEILGKPGTPERAEAQLKQAAGNQVTFFTGLCLVNSATGNYQLDKVKFEVFFRPLTDIQIRRYVERDKPLDCAGSFKWESLGISLFTKMRGDDVTALQGLPLIRLVDMLAAEGVSLLSDY